MIHTRNLWLALAAFVVWVIATYGLARVGEPQSVWMWRDVLGVIRK